MSNERVSRISSAHSAWPMNRNTTTVPCDRSEVISWDTGEVLRSFPRPHEYFFLFSSSFLSLARYGPTMLLRRVVSNVVRRECRRRIRRPRVSNATPSERNREGKEINSIARETSLPTRHEGKRGTTWRVKREHRQVNASLEQRVAYPNCE